MLQGKLAVILWRIISILLLIGIIFLQIYLVNISKSGSTPTPPTGFSFTTITLKNGQALPNPQPVSIPVAQLPLTITGTYSSQGSEQVWVVVEDLSGNYYLQTTPVRFASGGVVGQWSVPNVNTNVGTTKIDFVSVTEQGQSIFNFMEQAKAYGAFTQFPDGSQVVQDISIQVTS